MEHVQERLRPGMRESEVGAIWNGWVHDHGTGYEGKVELALGFSLVWSGPGIRTFTATGSRPIAEHEPTLFEIWVCADGYWCDHTKNLVPGELTARYRELEEQLMEVYTYITSKMKAGDSLAELDRETRARLAGIGYPGQPSHPVCHGVGARAHEPPYAHQAGGGTIEAGMVLAIEPGVYWPEGGGLRRRGQLPHHRERRGETEPLPRRDRPSVSHGGMSRRQSARPRPRPGCTSRKPAEANIVS